MGQDGAEETFKAPRSTQQPSRTIYNGQFSIVFMDTVQFVR